MGVTIGCRLVHHVTKDMFRPKQIIVWTDSTTVLHWIGNGGPTKEVFVKNRLKEIQSLTRDRSVEFRHVPTDSNPADLPSRGCHWPELLSPFWTQGPDFIRTGDWPANLVTTCIVATLSQDPVPETNPMNELLQLQNFSCLNRAIRLTAWIRRFCYNMRRGLRPPRSGPLTNDEILESTMFWIQSEQKRFYPTDVETLSSKKPLSSQSPLWNLRPVWDPKTGTLVMQPRTGQCQLIIFQTSLH